MHQIDQQIKLMGNAFEFTAIHDSLAICKESIDAGINEVKRIETFLSTYKEDSEVNKINHAAGIKEISVSEELFCLIERCQKISELTQGAFDLSYGSIDKSLWNFDTTMNVLPSKELANKSIALINYRNIILDKKNNSVFLKNKGMRIGFGGIGKGYAAERAKKVMKEMKIANGAVNAAGDLTVWGKRKDGNKWQVGVAIPEQKNSYFTKIAMDEGSIATSGNYEKFILINGKKYSHTIDPRTGFPIQGIKSTSIICQNAELADALTTPVTIMGVQAGLYLVNQLKDIFCVIIDDDNKVHISNNFNNFKKN